MDTGIVIANTGSPSAPTPDAVETYLSSYLMDPHIRQLPKIAWNILLRKAILPKRRFSSSERYRFVWEEGGAPLVAHQERLRAKVQWMCNREGLLPSATGGVSVRSAMSYGDPSMADALASLREDGSERVLCLPLYPQTASCITGSVADSFERTLAELGWDPPRRVVEGYAQNAFYLEAVASSIEGRGFGQRPDDRLVLSFHSVPLKDERAGDTYRQQARQTADAVAERLGVDPASVTVSYQSVFGPDPSAWARPLSLDVLRGWRDQKFRVFFCCPGFAVECLETLYDVPQELLSALEGDEVEPPSPARCLKGGAIGPRGRFVWVPCLDDSDAHAVVVRSVIDDALRDGSWTGIESSLG